MTFTSKSIALPTGVTLSYVEQGDPNGVPVILLHGVTDSWRSFELVLPYLPPRIHAFALSQRGHGDTDRPMTGYGFRDFAADVAAFMDTLQLHTAVVLGHSMGSGVAQRFALAYPERLSGVVLVGSFATLPTNPVVREFWDTVVSTLRDPIEPRLVREFQQSTLARPVPAAFFETVVNESLKVPARVWRATFTTFLQEDWAGELRKITAPTLIVWGDQDVFCPRGDQDLLVTAIADSRLRIYPNAGHAPHWEEPERFANEVITFIAWLAASSGRREPQSCWA
ncbi:MAG: alpha/beta hydrolase [Deltaproteobacteria bacterium]|nr:alpha/beta hydrolase [Deltaproteobacteria bacterium]